MTVISLNCVWWIRWRVIQPACSCLFIYELFYVVVLCTCIVPKEKKFLHAVLQRYCLSMKYPCWSWCVGALIVGWSSASFDSTESRGALATSMQIVLCLFPNRKSLLRSSWLVALAVMTLASLARTKERRHNARKDSLLLIHSSTYSKIYSEMTTTTTISPLHAQRLISRLKRLITTPQP